MLDLSLLIIVLCSEANCTTPALAGNPVSSTPYFCLYITYFILSYVTHTSLTATDHHSSWCWHAPHSQRGWRWPASSCGVACSRPGGQPCSHSGPQGLGTPLPLTAAARMRADPQVLLGAGVSGKKLAYLNYIAYFYFIWDYNNLFRFTYIFIPKLE